MILAMIVDSLIGWVICSSLLAAWLGHGADVVFSTHNYASSLGHSTFVDQLALGDKEFSGPCMASTRWRLELCLLGALEFSHTSQVAEWEIGLSQTRTHSAITPFHVIA